MTAPTLTLREELSTLINQAYAADTREAYTLAALAFARRVVEEAARETCSWCALNIPHTQYGYTHHAGSPPPGQDFECRSYKLWTLLASLSETEERT